MSSQKLDKDDQLYLRELQSHLAKLQHDKDGFSTSLRNCQVDIEHARESQKLLKRRLRIIDLRISDAQKSIKSIGKK